MLNITPFSSACVKIDRYLDYVPAVSTLTNLVDIFLKCVYKPSVGESKIQSNHYFAYLNTKSISRSIILTIPILGNILIAAMDLYGAIKAEEFEGLAEHLNAPHEVGNAVRLYMQAASFGSVEARYQLGLRLLSGTGGINQIDKPMGIQNLRAAAAVGHVKAQEALASL
ncbi:MAG: hypothetical protein S4CHLAM7_02920 [Chlamydiae bacterium]|nr:hypothetical protein [Chlamydiota bacterium]